MTTLLTPTIDAATRREFIALLGAAGLLTACGSDDGDSGPDPVRAARTVTNRFGTFEVPADPRRVIALSGRRDLETAVVLGLGIVGVADTAIIDGQQRPSCRST